LIIHDRLFIIVVQPNLPLEKCGEWLYSQILQNCFVLKNIKILKTKIVFLKFFLQLSIKNLGDTDEK